MVEASGRFNEMKKLLQLSQRFSERLSGPEDEEGRWKGDVQNRKQKKYRLDVAAS